MTGTPFFPRSVELSKFAFSGLRWDTSSIPRDPGIISEEVVGKLWGLEAGVGALWTAVFRT